MRGNFTVKYPQEAERNARIWDDAADQQLWLMAMSATATKRSSILSYLVQPEAPRDDL